MGGLLSRIARLLADWAEGEVGALFREEGGDEGFLKVEDVAEVFEGVGVLLTKDLLANEGEDHFADVHATLHSPFAQEGHGHGAELFEGEVAKSDEQFGAGDVAVFAFALFFGPVDGEVEGFFEKVVGIGIKAGITVGNSRNRFLKGASVHVEGPSC